MSRLGLSTRARLWTAFPLLAALAACNPRLEPGEGFVAVRGGRVWYRVVGEGRATPLLVLHGGPGFPSYYLKPLAALSDERPVIFYDQLGAGHSDQPADTSLWRTERFVDELARVRRALGLRRVHILGHSWGTMLAVDYMLTGPLDVQSLVLASPALSVDRWMRDAAGLLATMPDSTQRIIASHEAAGTTDSPAYQAAVTEFYRRYLLRRDPWPADVESTFAQANLELYGIMWGPSEFRATGRLRDYDRTRRLHAIRVPALITGGRFDEVTPATVEYYQALLPGSQVVIFDSSAHLTMQDQPERYVEVVRQFLRGVESRR